MKVGMTELSKEMSTLSGREYTIEECRSLIKIFLTAFKNVLIREKVIRLSGICTFRLEQRKGDGKFVVNPRDGKAYPFKDKTVVKFSMGHTLKRELNEGR